MQIGQHTLYSLQSQTSNYNYVHWYISFIISEVLAVFAFRLFFYDSPDDGRSELLRNVLPICMALCHIPDYVYFHERR